MPANNYVPVSRTFQKIVDGNSVKYDILLIQFIKALIAKVMKYSRFDPLKRKSFLRLFFSPSRPLLRFGQLLLKRIVNIMCTSKGTTWKYSVRLI